MVLRPRIALLHCNPQISRRITGGLARSGYDVLCASGKADGLPLIYDVQPDLILLEAANSSSDTVETVSNIRLITDVPIFLLAARELDPSDLAAAACSQVITPPFAASKIAAAIRARLKPLLSLSLEAPSAPECAAMGSDDDGSLTRQTVWLRPLLSQLRNTDASENMIFQALLKNIWATLKVDWVALYLRDPSLVQAMKLKYWQGAAGREWTQAQRQFVDDHVADALKSHRPVFQGRHPTGSESRASHAPYPEGLGEAVFVPCIGRDQVHGILVAVTEDTATRHFAPRQIRFLMTTGEALAIAMDSRPIVQMTSGDASLDSVTGLYSQSFAERVINTERQWSMRRGHQFSVVQLVWVDRYQFLKTYGSSEYVTTLRHIANVCQRTVRASDVVARCLDDSIVFVLPELEPTLAQRVADRVQQALAKSFADLSPEARPQVSPRVLERPEAALFEAAEGEKHSPFLSGLASQ